MDQEALKRYIELDQEIKELEKAKFKLRREIIEENIAYYFENKHLLETKQVTVPLDFFERVDIDPQDFVLSRFPAWDLDNIRTTENEAIFHLTRQPDYTGRELDDGENVISHSIMEGTPNIDWDSMFQDDPELADKISKLSHVRELDEKKLQNYINDHPEAFSVLERHLMPPIPKTRIVPKRRKNA